MMLPNAERAVIEPAKLRDYLLSDSHPLGRYKAAFFRSLGYTRDRWGELDAAIRRLVASSEAELDENSRYGQKYRVTGKLGASVGQARTVVTVWIVLAEEESPRFITAFPGEPR